MLSHIRQKIVKGLKYTTSRRTREQQAIDYIQEMMVFYRHQAKSILKVLLEKAHAAEKSDGKLIISIYQKLKQADDMVLDCASKLAPYQTPKLETVNVKSEVKHQIVMRIPAQMEAEEWKKATGAEEIKVDPTEAKNLLNKVSEVVPSLHDFDEDDNNYYNKERLN